MKFLNLWLLYTNAGRGRWEVEEWRNKRHWARKMDRQGCPLALQPAQLTMSGHHAAIFFWKWSHWLQLPRVSLHTHVWCHVNKHASECLRVTDWHWWLCFILNHSFTDSVWKYSRENYTLTHTGKYNQLSEQLSNQCCYQCSQSSLQYILPNTQTLCKQLHPVK